jgi:misacylated tRNA(Ala) deacylase
MEYIYWNNSYQKEAEATITKIYENKIYVDKLLFHPKSGGLVSDTGEIVKGEKRYQVKEVIKEGEDAAIIIENPNGLYPGDKIIQVLNWERRYRLMRLHTATHIIAALIYKRFNAGITGGEITPEYARDDYNVSLQLPEFQEAMKNVIEEANQVITKGIELKIYYLSREEALKIPGIVKLVEKAPPNITTWRIVEIPGIDIQADGGPHVTNTAEIGKIKLIKVENRGKSNKRAYYTVK